MELKFLPTNAGNINFRRILMKADDHNEPVLSAREQVILQHTCSELTYKQIAAEMSLAKRTIDGYREALFKKFNLQSRV